MTFFENDFSKITFDIAKVGSLFYTIVFLGQLQNLTLDRGRVMIQVDPNMSYCTSFDAPWCGKHNEPNSHVCISSQSKVISKQFGDFKWPQMTFRGITAQNLYLTGSSWMVKQDTIMSELRRPDVYLWNRKDFNILPLAYNGSSKRPDLKSPIYIIRVIQVLGTLTKLWKFETDRKKHFGLSTTSNLNNRSREVGWRDLFWWPELTLPEILFAKMCTMNVPTKSESFSLMAPGVWRWVR